ncbi:DNA repair protein RecN [Sphingomonas astaxanthinifaciens]|uniref:DNA repair protein RecN n=1 Tax=Sphingomonas astaxanthinifaciens DSM 22298 TaxID=1123267 RepID=A0ABQ5Z3F7_9SPHN|nr:DNA repair protein RecN [Sphingomonas astaxanthinifaciens]GLR47320.1 DNA repair protein RecN [Sphingomonas astaxanthinifaciens DSM 22298]
MLRQLVIRDVVLIDRLTLDFGEGLGVLTGETGAGKSILLDSLGLALGMRADSGLVRAGQDGAAVTAEFELGADHPALGLLDEAGVDRDGDEPLIFRRTLKADGGSRAFLAGAPVPAATLREIGSSLVEIHGQHDDRGLLNPKGHRAMLDSFGRVDTAPVARAWTRLTDLRQELDQLRRKQDDADRDREFLEHSVAELRKLEPEEGEEQALADKRAAMKQFARIADDLDGLQGLFTGSEGGLSQLRQAARRLERITDAHPLLAEALAALDRAIIDASEAEDKVERARGELDFSPDDLEAAEARLFELRGLARKHRVEPDQLPQLLRQMEEALDTAEGGSARIAELERALDVAESDYAAAAAALTETRAVAAARLDAAVAAELAPLKLEAARFRTVVAPGEPGPNGADRVEFEVSTNPGAPFGALIRIASGGELSRFILALKVALAEEGSASTMIFDEIDRGVGGAVASAIGERLARLAQRSQLLVVTHSPQVAARAAHHYRIEKNHGEDGTRTTVRLLSPDERREEIARMLSGAAVTDEARAQAARLLETA